jgi:hypothetical protein
MQSVLEREAASDVAAMLRALQQTLDFEQQLDRKFANQVCTLLLIYVT